MKGFWKIQQKNETKHFKLMGIIKEVLYIFRNCTEWFCYNEHSPGTFTELH